jgi:hypothetical protein
MTGPTPQLGQLLDDGARLAQLSPPQWDQIIRHARAAGLLGRLRVAAADAGALDRVPEQVMRHLESAWLLAERQREAACWEIERLHGVLYPAGIPLILLKGGGYAFTGHPAGRGRTFQDIDILVPPGALKDVERLLGADGWARKQVTPHDRRYYEEWMHEIPPLRQSQRGTNLDVHRAITPPIGRYPVDTEQLLAAAQAVPGWDDLYVLSPEDQFLHAVAHLFLEEEFQMGYRDMIDLRLLYRAATRADADFAQRLDGRAATLGLHRPLTLAANALAELLDFETPLRQRPGVIDALFARVLLPDHPDLQNWSRHMAATLLYLRGHRLKLPLRLLLPHLAYKALLARRAEEKQRNEHEQARAELQRMIGPRR